MRAWWWGIGSALLVLGNAGCSACTDFGRFVFEEEDAGPDAGHQLDSGPGDDAEVDAFSPDAGMDDAGMDDAGMDDAGMDDGGTDAGGCPEFCDDGMACNGIHVCDASSGTCVLGTSATPCDDGIACTIDGCEEPTGICTHRADDTLCADGELCMFVDGTCDDTRTCAADADCSMGERCYVGLCCQPPAGGCVTVPCATQADCDDGVFCNGTETCNTTTGTCESGAMVDCDDGIGCTVDRCDEDLNTCARTPTDAFCEDGLFCNGIATCSATADCVPGTTPDCDDLDPCTRDDCNEAGRACRYRTRDDDMDGHGDATCPATGGVPADDCDDTDPMIYPGAIDVCNGVDDDCDGTPDEMNECAAGSTGTCTTGCGTTGNRVCSSVCVWSVCTPPFEACNGADDNCNSLCDESFACCAGRTSSCTTSCGTTGSTTCAADCTAGACTPPAETCNGLDDDCDTMPDDGFTCVQGTTIGCRTSCGSTGSQTCMAPGCTYGTCVPPGEACNGLDDDCDARIDESVECTMGTTGPCTTSCGTTGSRTCGAMCTWGACTPPAEACNAMDDDCDGLIDDGLPCIQGTSSSCVTSCGTTGTRMCSATCMLGACVPPAEVCNGGDDDCDGMSDETFTCRAGATRSCSTSCGSTGTQTCTSSCEWGTCNPPVEICNGADDDCDGSADEGFTCRAGASESCGSSCGTSGTRTCSAMCTWGACLPPAESCNGGDDDCDGACDDGFTCCAGTTGTCSTSCGSMGTRVCSSGCAWGVCNPPAETCNALDDDCDGTCDDGFTCCRGTTGTCTTSCGSMGSRTCNSSCAWGSCAAPAEICNGMDDDCDAACDEGFSCCRGTTLSCMTSCGSTGTRVCTSSCTVPSTCTPPGETCNGADDDCDGTCDDGFACCQSTTGPCTTSCGSTGTSTCSATCTAGACVPPLEVCNGADDDCDGSIDEGFPMMLLYRDRDGDGYGAGPATGMCSAPPGWVSIGGDCDDSDPAVSPGATEACNDRDDDCDLFTDEGCDDDGDSTCDATLPYGGPPEPAACSGGPGDCNDMNPAISPRASEVCGNAVDDDCDTIIDECPPPNDLCTGAINLGRINHGTPGARMGDSFDLANRNVTDCGSGAEIWYRFDISEPMIMYFDDFNTSFDASLSIRPACTAPATACNNDECGLNGDVLVMHLTTAGTYYVAVHARDAASMSGTVDLHYHGLRPASHSNTRVTATTTYAGLSLPPAGAMMGRYAPSCVVTGGNPHEAGYYFNVCPGMPGRTTRATNCAFSSVGDVTHYLIDPLGSELVCRRDNCGTSVNREDAATMPGVGLHMWIIDSNVAAVMQSYSVTITP